MANRILLQEATDAALWGMTVAIIEAVYIKGLRCRKKHPDSSI